MYFMIMGTTIVLSLLCLWGVVLTTSTITLLTTIHTKNRRMRKEDIFQCIGIVAFVLIVGSILTFNPLLISKYISCFVAIAVGTLFTFVYLTQRQIYHCRAVKNIK